MDAKVQQKLNDVRTPDGVPLPHNGVAALWRRVERFQLINQEIRTIERQRLLCLQRDLNSKSNAMVSVLVRTIALGVEIVEQLVHEILSRNLRGRKAVACYAGVNRAKDLPVGVYMRDILGSASASAVDLGASAARIMCCRRGGFASEHLRA
jgi:hypothetical protein